MDLCLNETEKTYVTPTICVYQLQQKVDIIVTSEPYHNIDQEEANIDNNIEYVNEEDV